MNRNAARILLILIAGALPFAGARADEEMKLAIGARGNWETGLASVMADGVAFKYLAAPLSERELGELFRIPKPLD